MQTGFHLGVMKKPAGECLLSLTENNRLLNCTLKQWTRSICDVYFSHWEKDRKGRECPLTCWVLPSRSAVMLKAVAQMARVTEEHIVPLRRSILGFRTKVAMGSLLHYMFSIQSPTSLSPHPPLCGQVPHILLSHNILNSHLWGCECYNTHSVMCSLVKLFW